jgi:hypothetical protein
LKPIVRSELREGLDELQQLQEHLAYLQIEISGGLPEPTEEHIESTRKLVRRPAPTFHP